MDQTLIDESPTSEPTTKGQFRWRIGKTIQMVIRRLHLYTGLFLWPWAILYGFTAFLFNHPEAFPDRPTITLTREHIAGTELENLPNPKELAGEVVQALREANQPSSSSNKVRKTDPATYKLLDSTPPKFQRSAVFFRVTGADTQHSVFVRLTSGTGRIREEPISKKKSKKKERPEKTKNATRPPKKTTLPTVPDDPATFAVKSGLRTKTLLVDQLRRGLKSTLAKFDISAEQVTLTRGTNLVFQMEEADGKVWTMSYDIQQGSLRSVSEDKEGPEMSTRRFLTRLHIAHGYPEDVGARWFWAMGVDVLAFVLVFWGLSGLVMWWQLKSQRKIGAIILILSSITVTCMVVGMDRALMQ